MLNEYEHLLLELGSKVSTPSPQCFFYYFQIIESESLGECEVFGFEMNMSIISWKQGFNAEPQSFSKLPIVPGRILAFPLITNKFKRQSSFEKMFRNKWAFS